MSLKARLTLLLGLAIASTAALAADVIEYYHKGLDHYFVTSIAGEIQALDSGKQPGWVRTGLTFQIFNTGSASLAGSVPVCRFYGNPAKGLNSHFYSASTAECDAVKQQFPDAWLLEADEVFRVHPVNPTSGLCPANTKAVYRLWNKRSDVNHRYTTDSTVVDAMLAKGYVLEGFGSSSRPVAFCAANIAPAQPAAGAPLCTIASSSQIPVIGTPITLTATCTQTPTSFVWINCSSSGSTCAASETAVGPVTYGVIATNTKGSSAPATLTLTWQNAASAAPTCTVSANSPNPTVGTPLTLTANCSHSPGTFSWMSCSALLIDACNFLTQCPSSSATCNTVSTQAGAVHYAVVANNSAGASPKSGVTVTWQTSTTQPPPPTGSTPFCTITPSSTTPAINTTLTLTASCTNNPTSYQWSNCTSTTNVCTTTQATAGSRSYSMTASNAAGVSSPANVTINWQQPPTAPPVCTVSASNPTPYVGSSVTLTANCTQSPTSFQWTGCSSSSSTCSATSSTTGQASYSVVASNSFGASSPASVNVDWQAAPPPGTDFCGSYSSVLRETLTQPPGNVVYTKDLGGWKPNGVVAAKFTTGANPSTVSGRASIVEYIDGPAYRYMTVSTSACDFRPVDPTGASGPIAHAAGQTPDIILDIATSGNGKLRPNTTYYINARNYNPFATPPAGTCTKPTCNALLTLSWPR